MNTIELYLKVLKHVRYEILAHPDVTINDFEPGSKSYNLLTSINDACNELSNLIDIMRYER